MLIDKQGKIVFKGHPKSRSNLEKDFDDLLQDKELDVKAEEEDDEEEDKKEFDDKLSELYNKEIALKATF